MPTPSRQYLFYGLKLPVIVMLILFGFIMEFMVELPFNLMTRLGGRNRRSRS